MSDQSETWKPLKLQYCFVSTCKNSSTKTPEKLFFKVPYNNREAWSRAAGRSDVPKSSVNICEDHIDPEQDIENYIRWKFGKARSKLRMEVPAKLLALKLYDDAVLQSGTSSTRTTGTQPSVFREDKIVCCVPDVKNVSVQANVDMANKIVQVNIQMKSKKNMLFNIEDILTDEENLPSTQGSSVELSETTTDSVKEITPKIYVNFTSIVKNKPYKYLGIPENYKWLVDIISKDTGVSKLHIYTVLYKLKHGDPFYKISDLFDISETTLWRIFPSTLDLLATICARFIYWPTREDIKNNLPMSFRTKKEFSNTLCIIDCFEIEIEKPSNPVHQAATWSQYKNCNTVKFLISATPDGFITFISKGFCGRISDMKLVEESGFLSVVKSNSTILADRGFKHLEPVLQRIGLNLLRPPSVYSNKKLTKSEAIETKVIASLRIHIERVIRRVRLFKFLKPHSTINNKIVNCVDDAVTVACGLINLQSPIIKIK